MSRVKKAWQIQVCDDDEGWQDITTEVVISNSAEALKQIKTMGTGKYRIVQICREVTLTKTTVEKIVLS